MRKIAIWPFLIFILVDCKQIDKGRESVADNVPDLDKGKGDLYNTAAAADSDPSAIPAPLSIEVHPKDLKLAEGMTASFTAIGKYPYFSRDLTPHVEWKTMDPNIIVFDDPRSGNIATSKMVGKVLVTATFKDIVGEQELEVIPSEIKAMAIDTESTEIPITPNVAGGFFAASVTFKNMGVFTNQQIIDLTTDTEWKSSDPEIADFNANTKGILTFKKAGKITVNCTWGTFGASKQITAKAAPVVLTAIEASDSLIDLPVGLSKNLTVTGTYSNGEKKDVTAQVKFSSANVAVAAFGTVETPQKVTAKEIGKTTLLLSIGDIKASVPFVTTNAVLTKLDVTPKDVSQPLGVQMQFTVTGLFSNGKEINMTSSVGWTSSDLAIATISNEKGNEGVITSNITGPVILTATFEGMSASTSVTITAAQLTTITVNPNAVTMAKGMTTVVTATGTYTDGKIIDISNTAKWIAGSPSVVSVSDAPGTKGVVVGVGVGNSTIRASYEGIIGQITASITAAQVVSLDVTAINPSVALGRTKQFRAIATYTDSAIVDVTDFANWTFDIISPGYNYAGYVSDDAGTKGLATSIAEGKVKIIASYGNQVDTLDLTVTEKEVTYIAVTAPKTTAFVGEAIQYTATAYYTNATTRNVTNLVGDPDLSILWTQVDNTTEGEVITINSTNGLANTTFEGGATVTARLTSIKFATNWTGSLGLSVETNCSFGGTRVSYFCFVLSNLGDSCTTACTLAGANYHQATRYHIGSAGLDQNCGTTLNALGITGGIDSSGTEPGGLGLGCSYYDFPFEINARYSAPLTIAGDSHPDFRRACACAP